MSYECCYKLKHQKCARAPKEGGLGTRRFIFLSGKLLHFFLGLCDYSDKFPKIFCSSCAGECPSTANFCHQCGQQLNLSQVSKKGASSVDKEKLLKKYHGGYPYEALIMCKSDCGSGCFKVLWCILSLILGASDKMSNRFRFFCCKFITASDCRSRCPRFMLCKVLLVSLIIDFFAQESAGGNLLGFFLGILE